MLVIIHPIPPGTQTFNDSNCIRVEIALEQEKRLIILSTCRFIQSQTSNHEKRVMESEYSDASLFVYAFVVVPNDLRAIGKTAEACL